MVRDRRRILMFIFRSNGKPIVCFLQALRATKVFHRFVYPFLGGWEFSWGQGTTSDCIPSTYAVDNQCILNELIGIYLVDHNQSPGLLQNLFPPRSHITTSVVCLESYLLIKVDVRCLVNAFAILKIAAQLLKHLSPLKVSWESLVNSATLHDAHVVPRLATGSHVGEGSYHSARVPWHSSPRTNTCSGKLLSHQQFSQVSGKTCSTWLLSKFFSPAVTGT